MTAALSATGKVLAGARQRTAKGHPPDKGLSLFVTCHITSRVTVTLGCHVMSRWKLAEVEKSIVLIYNGECYAVQMLTFCCLAKQILRHFITNFLKRLSFYIDFGQKNRRPAIKQRRSE